MRCWLPSPKPAAGLKTLGSVVSRPSPKSPFAKVLVSATSAFWRRSPSWHRGSLRGLSTAPRQPISPSPGSRNDCPTRGPTRSDGSGPRIHNIPEGLHNALQHDHGRVDNSRRLGVGDQRMEPRDHLTIAKCRSANRSPSVIEPVCGTPKRKLENGEQ